MNTFIREQYKSNPLIELIFNSIKSSHKVPEFTATLINTKGKDFTEEAQHFAHVTPVGTNQTYYFNYIVHTWKEKGKFAFSIESITVYHNYVEYETARTVLLGRDVMKHNESLKVVKDGPKQNK